MSNKQNYGVRFVSPYPPATSGIATFTADLMKSIKQVAPNVHLSVTVIKWHDDGRYSDEVADQIRPDQRSDFRRAAQSINKDASVDVVCIQHEFGLYGGRGGGYILEFIRHLRKPFVITLHSIPIYKPHPFRTSQLSQIRVMAKYAKAIIVPMPVNKRVSSEIGLSAKLVKTIPHGIPTVAFNKRNIFELRRQLQMEHTPTLITFGLLRKTKGLEVVIKSLPKIILSFPNVRYLVIGEAARGKDKSYLTEIQQLALDLKVSDYIEFNTEYLSESELLDYLAAADICVTPYTIRNQISSGTLLWAFAVRTPIISTRYIFAEYALAKARGKLISIGSTSQLISAVERLIHNPQNTDQMIDRAYQFAKDRTWTSVGAEYAEIFQSMLKSKNS